MQRLLAYSFQKGQQMLAPMPPSTHTAAAGWESSAVSNHYHAEALDASSPASAFAPDAASSSSSFSSSSLSSSSPSSPYSSLVESTSLLTSQFSYHAFLGSDKCTPEAWEKTWGVFFSIVFILYLCVVLVRVCDQHLIPSLEVLCKKWGLPEDVAGATLLAFGGSFPELAIHTIATLEGSEIGVGTVIGSAVFNVTIGLSIVAFLSPWPVTIKAGPLIRDSLVYMGCLSLILLFFNWNSRVTWWQAGLMLLLYVLYVLALILKFQHSTGTGVFSPRSAAAAAANAKARDEALAAAAAAGKTSSSGGAGDIERPNTELISGNGNGHADDSSALAERSGNGNGNGNGHSAAESPEVSARGVAGEGVSQRKNAGAGERSVVVENESDEERDEEARLLSGAGSSSSSSSSSSVPPPFSPNPTLPKLVSDNEMTLHDYTDDDPNAGIVRKTYYVINTPTDYLNRKMIPDCTKPGNHHFYLKSFLVSLIIVLIVSFLLMCIVQYMGCISGIDHALTGLLVLGVAASLPDIISVGVSARRGLGVMAVSGLVGSNVFDVLVGLGFPWLLHMLIHNIGYVPLTSGKVYTGSILAVVSILVLGMSFLVNGMKLQTHVAWMPIVMYIVYIICVATGAADPPEDAPKPAFF